ncbi:hypothetical protein GEV33_009256 [Tenebrio molitor]|uniref:Cytochrome b5 heme-binding domain-containing protein n=1 Tax=Tenebrio molitor TaxID=7067 RepID=A0A8J6H7P4_TENMO|nr:hypothetical protein GEV33_009256 [Tenebrio molitor]
MPNLTELQKHVIRQRLGEDITIRAIVLFGEQNTVLLAKQKLQTFVNVWGCISIRAQEFVKLWRRGLRAPVYVRILREIMLPSVTHVFGERNFIFQDGNCRVHRARVVREFLDEQGKIDEMEDSKEFKVNHSGVNYNIFKFLNNHPGGINYVKPYEEKEVTQRMHQTQHSKAAYYLLREYRSGGRDTSSKADQEDLEALVDWDKPMLGQVANLGARYNEWVVSPVDRKLRLFCNPILESLTITPWYVVPLVWIPIILYFIVHGTRKYIQLTEGCLNRDHVDLLLLNPASATGTYPGPPQVRIPRGRHLQGAANSLLATLLVFPPVPAAVIAYAIYQICTLFVPESVIVLVIAGGLTGYVIYDMIHFYLHYGAPKEGSYFYHLKRYHNQHHFAHHDSGFGISSVFWDKIFGSAIKLRQLAMAIKCANEMEDKKFEVKYSGNAYNIFEFLNRHPGGINYITPCEKKEVTQRMHQTQHAKAAYYLLREYRVGGRDTSSEGDQEDLEVLVDWDRPMLSQVAKLGTRYSEWVVSPVDKKLRLFDNPILESLTLTPWYVVPLVWVPIIVCLMVHGTRKYVQLTGACGTFNYVTNAYCDETIIYNDPIFFC